MRLIHSLVVNLAKFVYGDRNNKRDMEGGLSRKLWVDTQAVSFASVGGQIVDWQNLNG